MPRWPLALCLLAVAAAPVPEPQSYWQGPTDAPTPQTLTGGTVIHTQALITLLTSPSPPSPTPSLRGALATRQSRTNRTNAAADPPDAPNQRAVSHPTIVLIDVANAPRRPPNLRPGAVWLPLTHRDIPTSVWIPGAGLGAIPPEANTAYRTRLAALTHNNPSTKIVIYCHERCWLSWNAAKRAISYGYRNVAWYPDGVEGWTSAAQPTQIARPAS